MSKIMMTYKEAKSYIKDKNLKNKRDYLNYWYANKEECKRIGLPQHPDKYYDKKNDKRKNNN
jgi:hypothetical protein